jgi:Dicarboxylate transport
MLRVMAAMNAKPFDNSEQPPHGPGGRRFRAWKLLAVFCLLLIVGTGALVAERKPIAAFLVQSYLLRHGIVSTVEFDRLARGGFIARVKVGGERPEFSADIFDVTLSYDGIFTIPTVGTVRLVRPVLHTTYDGERLSFGSLQPLVDEALAKEPEGPGPSVTVENGTFVVSAPEGTLQFAVDGAIAGGALTSLSAKLSPTQWRGPLFDADVAGGEFSAKLNNGALDSSARVVLRNAAWKQNMPAQLRDVSVSAEIKGVQWRKANDQISFSAASGTLAARSAMLQSAKAATEDFDARLVFEKAAGTRSDAGTRVVAQLELTSTAVGLRMDMRSATKPVLRATFSPATIALTPNESSIGGPMHLVMDVPEARQKLAAGGAALRAAHADFSGDAKLSDTDFAGTLDGSLTGTAAMPREVTREFVAGIPVISADPALSEAFVRALSKMDARIPRLRVARSATDTSVALLAEASVSGPDNARLAFSGKANRPLFRRRNNSVDGGFDLRLRGGGLPELDLGVASYRANWNGQEVAWNASTRFETRMDLADLRGLHVKGAGEIESSNGRLSFVLPQCSDTEFTAYRGDKGELLNHAKARLCAEASRPLMIADKSGWQFSGRLSGVSAHLEQAQSLLADGSGTITLAERSGVRTGRLEADHAVVSDLLKEARFRPLNLDGAMDLSGEDWRGTFALAARGRRFASVAVHHDMHNGSGEAAITAQDIAFDPTNFQPGDISPLLSAFATRVRGRASFGGEVRWTTQQLESSGRVRLTGIDFQSRVGQVRQTNGELSLTSLMPVTLAPRQTVSMERIDWFVPLEQAKVQFSLSPSEIALDSAAANMAGGRVSLDPERFAFAPESTTQGTLHLEHVDPAPLLAAAGLADRIKMQARVQGVVPFTFGPAGLRFANGRIAAEGPGRLSVQREAVTAAVGTSGGAAAQPTAVQDFAYQALENLAFDQLSGEVNSLPEGRLGILLHVKGVHDPAEAVETRVGVGELLQGRAFDKPLPLPKGTPIDLTLDTSLNLDELLGSYFDTTRGAAMAAP